MRTEAKDLLARMSAASRDAKLADDEVKYLRDVKGRNAAVMAEARAAAEGRLGELEGHARALEARGTAYEVIQVR